MELLLKADMGTRQRFVCVKSRDFRLELLNGINAALSDAVHERLQQREQAPFHAFENAGRPIDKCIEAHRDTALRGQGLLHGCQRGATAVTLGCLGT